MNGDGSVVDLLLIVAGVLFAVAGLRQGLVVGLFGFAGFLAGALIGGQIAPAVVNQVDASGPRAAVGVVIVFGAAMLAQLVAVSLGRVLRTRLKLGLARTVETVGGAVVSVVAMLLVAWMVATPLATVPLPGVSSQLRGSVILNGVNKLMPPAVSSTYGSLQKSLTRNGFPEVFGPLVPTKVQDVRPPDAASVQTRGVARARASILKIVGMAPKCSRRLEGSGFVYARDRVMTNAHVLAGVQSATVQVGNREINATVVLYDPELDIAVLSVPGVDRPALPFQKTTSKGAPAVVAGYPLDGPFSAVPARVRGQQSVHGPDIYNDKDVTRAVYTLRAQVRNGNSGGPLLTPAGAVLGVVFAAAADDTETGFALTADAVQRDAVAGARATSPVSTQSCD